MDGHQFDLFARSLGTSPSRRRFLGGLVATLALGAPRLIGMVEAKHKKRHKHKNKTKLVLNAFGCVDVGGKCKGNSDNCCSGICEGNKPKHGKNDTSTCLAHNVGECQAGDDFCVDTEVLCGTVGRCFRTTGAASFCGRKGDCAICAKDTDCEADFGPGSSCIVCATCGATNNTACVPPAELT
jgi:hypothetical protein